MNDPILTSGGGRYPAEFAAFDRRSACASHTRRVLAALFLGFLAAVLLAMSLQAKPAQAAECTSSLQAKIDAAAAGSTVTADPCVYREQVSITKPLKLQGQPGSEIRGSDIWGSSEWTSFTKKGVRYYRSNKEVGPFFQESTTDIPADCASGTKDCAYPEQVFRNGTELKQVYALPQSGQFQYEPTSGGRGKIVVRDTPASYTLEVTVRRHWVTGGSTVDNVTIDSFAMKHAANEKRSGGIQPREPTTLKSDGTCCDWARFKADGDAWTITNNTLQFAHGAILSVRGSDNTITGNEIAYAGTLGVHNPGDNSLLDRNHIHHNNTQLSCYEAGKCSLYDTDTASRALLSGSRGPVEAGGVKIAGGRSFERVTNNEINHNQGRGLWADVETTDQTWSGNRIHHNWRSGMFFEISNRAVIRDNIIWENGWKTPNGNGGAGIAVNNSSDATIENNTLAWNAGGIFVESTKRANDPGTEYIKNITVTGNRILSSDTPLLVDSRKLAIGFVQGWTDSTNYLITASANSNQSSSNKVYFPTEENDTYDRYQCVATKYKKLAEWNASACTTGDSNMTSVEKDAGVSTYGIPTNPEH